VLTAQASDAIAFDVRRLVLEVEKKPQFEAWVRHRYIDGVVPCLLPGFGDKGVLVNVEYAPDVVVAQVVVFSALGFALGFLLESYRQLHHRFWHAAGYNLHFDYPALLHAEVLEIARLGDSALANNQETRERLSEPAAAA
jgi:hypothetical protein